MGSLVVASVEGLLFVKPIGVEPVSLVGLPLVLRVLDLAVDDVHSYGFLIHEVSCNSFHTRTCKFLRALEQQY